MFNEKQGYGILLKDNAVRSMLDIIVDISYEDILKILNNNEISISQENRVNEEKSIKTKNDTILKPYYEYFNVLTYKGLNIYFKDTICSLYTNKDEYKSDLNRQLEIFSY